MIKVVVFDFGQTLVDSADGFRLAEKTAQERIFSDLRLTDQDEFLLEYRSIRKMFHNKSRFSRKAIWAVVYLHFKQESDPDTLELWETEYWQQVKENTVPFPETLTVLEALSADHQLALVTNTQGQRATDTHRISLFPELEQFFKVIIVAGEGGVPPKPDPVPFRLCLEQLGISPQEAVFVGDDWRIDICGARDAGMRPIWLKHRTVRRNWPDVETSVPVIESLNELIDLDQLLP